MGEDEAALLGPRLWQLDTARGASLVLMIIYHVFVDLAYSDSLYLSPRSMVMRSLAMVIGSSFLLIAGTSMVFDHASRSKGERYARHLRRGAIIFAWGIVITIVTYVIVPDRFIVFGILHCIGASIILASPIAGRGRLSLFVGMMVIVSGVVVSGITIDGWWLVWAGFRPVGFTTLDYYPLLPWCGVLLIGVFLGNVLVPRWHSLGESPRPSGVGPLIWVGRHSLAIYLVHQPIIVAVLQVIGLGPL